MDRAARQKELLKPSKRFLPIAHTRRDGGALMVYGFLTTEAVDTYDTVFSLDATRAALAEYEKWRTLRAMHQPIAAGTVPVLELDDVGLWIGARVVDEAEQRKVEEGVYKGFSIGFDPKDGRWVLRDGRDVFMFTAYELIESSLVDRNSNPETVITLWTRRAADYALAEKTAGWTFDWKNDADAILARGGQALLAQATAWRDSTAEDADEDGYPDAKGAYKLPVAKLDSPESERLTLYWYGVVAAMAALNGAREDLAIPEEDREGVHATLSALYALFDEKPPELTRRAQEDIMDEKQLETAIEKGVRGFFGRLFGTARTETKPPEKPPESEKKPEATRLALASKDAAGLKAAQGILGRAAQDNPAVKAAAEAVGALLTVTDEQTEPAQAPEVAALLETVKEQGRTVEALRKELDAVKAERKSAETVAGQQATQSRYGGVFAR